MGKFGKLPGKCGKLPGIAVKFHSERTSGEVAEKLPGKFGELPAKKARDFPEARESLTPSQRLAKFVSKVILFRLRPKNGYLSNSVGADCAQANSRVRKHARAFIHQSSGEGPQRSPEFR